MTIHASIGEGSADTALRLARHFVTSLQFWLNVQKAWELRQAEIAAARSSAGRVVTPADCQVAAVVRFREMSVATRNVRHFEGIDVMVVDHRTVA